MIPFNLFQLFFIINSEKSFHITAYYFVHLFQLFWENNQAGVETAYLVTDLTVTAKTVKEKKSGSKGQ